MELYVANAAGEFVLFQDVLGFKVSNRSVVYMDAGYEDSFARGSRGIGQHGSPAIVSVVANLAPIDGHENNRLPVTRQDETMREERIVNLLCRRDSSTHQGMSQWGSYIGAKCRKLISRLRPCKRYGWRSGPNHGADCGSGSADEIAAMKISFAHPTCLVSRQIRYWRGGDRVWRNGLEVIGSQLSDSCGALSFFQLVSAARQVNQQSASSAVCRLELGL